MNCSQTIFEALTTNSPIGIVILDMEGKVTACNPSFERLFGFKESEMIGKLLDPFISSSESYFENSNYTKRIISLGETIRISGKRQKKDKSLVDVEIQGIPLFEENKQIGLVTLYHDITDRVHAENTTRDLYTSFVHVMDSIGASVYVADMNTFEIIFMNQHMRDLFGGDHVGKTCYKVFRNDTQQCSICTNYKLINTFGSPCGEIVWEGQNPITNRWYRNYDRAITWADGRIVRLEVATDITDMKADEEKLIFMATHDHLTKLPNRSFFIDKLTELLNCNTNQYQFVVLFLDIDNFKLVNDQFGHNIGDKLLIQACERMKACLREQDTIARVSGDEFTIILNGLTDKTKAIEVVERILKAVSNPYQINGISISISVSIGISCPSMGYTTDQLMQESDEAMYQVKRDGKNGYCFFSSHPIFLEAMK